MGTPGCRMTAVSRNPNTDVGGKDHRETLPKGSPFPPSAFPPKAVVNVVMEPGTATKHDGAKPRTDLLPSKPLLMIADVLGFGAGKYADHNWRGGFQQSRLIGAAMRHILAYNDGEDLDPESGLSHIAHAGCTILFLLEHIAKGIGVDDRYAGATPMKIVRAALNKGTWMGEPIPVGRREEVYDMMTGAKPARPLCAETEGDMS